MDRFCACCIICELTASAVLEFSMSGKRHITVIVPAHNEELSIAKVLADILALNSSEGTTLVDEIIVCDNASTDNTASIARSYPCSVVVEKNLGYGAACQTALKYPGERDIIVFVDADCSVRVSEMPNLLEKIQLGADVVIGSRVTGYCEPGALTFPQQFGNWLASALIRFFWHYPVTDLGPFRAITHTALEKINMQDHEFGWTVEMQIRAIQENLNMVEVSVTTLRRVGKSKISGTVSGVIGAGRGILGTIFKLLWRQHILPVGSPMSVRGSRP
jgi:glycosyltransferase involved in cell wall biosynthesis